MAFIVSSNGVNNTAGTTARVNRAGAVRVGGNFINSGNVQIDTKANLSIALDFINKGNFSIKDYVAEEQYKLIDNAIDSLNGESKQLLSQTLLELKKENNEEATNKFKKFLNYIKDHPEVVTSSVQVMLQLITME